MRRGADQDEFQRRLDDAVLVLFTVVGEAVGWATEALLAQDTDRARSVIADDRSVDLRCDELTSLVKERLGKGAAPPDELEELVAVLQIIPELERSADLAEHIAQRALRCIGSTITPKSRGLISQMGAVVTDMWRRAGSAYRHRSKDAIFELKEADDTVDQLCAELVQDVIASDATPQMAIDLALVARFYERLGDHAVNLASRVEYMGIPRRLAPPRLPKTAGVATAQRGWFRRALRSFSRLRLAPYDDGFFDLFRAAARNCCDCAASLRKLVGSLHDGTSLFEEIKSYEHRGDELTVATLALLDRTFVTPFDREDIHRLSEELDDVVDAMLAAASLMELAHETDPPLALAEMTDTLIEMADELMTLVESLPGGQGARLHLERIGHLERQGDATFRRGMGRLLSGEYEPLAVIAWKDILAALEGSLNSIEDAADVVEGILVKNS